MLTARSAIRFSVGRWLSWQVHFNYCFKTCVLPVTWCAIEDQPTPATQPFWEMMEDHCNPWESCCGGLSIQEVLAAGPLYQAQPHQVGAQEKLVVAIGI